MMYHPLMKSVIRIYVLTYIGSEAMHVEGGCKTAIVVPTRMLLLFAKRCIILSAMSRISKRNTSGFTIVLRICSPIQFSLYTTDISLSLSFVFSLALPFPISDFARYALYLVPLLHKSCIAIDPRCMLRACTIHK